MNPRNNDQGARSIDQILKAFRQASLPILALPRLDKRTIALLVDVSLCVLTLWIAFYLRIGELVILIGKPLWAVGILLVLALLIFVVSGLYRAFSAILAGRCWWRLPGQLRSTGFSMPVRLPRLALMGFRER